MTPTPDKPAGEALKACPFCGGKVNSDCFERNREGLCTEPAVCCNACGYIMTFDFATAKPHTDVIAKFNTRTPPPSALDDEVAAVLEDLVADASKVYRISERRNVTWNSLAVSIALAKALLTRLKASGR